LLTALGIAIGIAAMVAVVGISASSRADLLDELDRLGTNLLEVKPGQSFLGKDSKLPVDVDDRPHHPGQDASAVGDIGRGSAQRQDLRRDRRHRRQAADTSLLDTATSEPGRFSGRDGHGRWCWVPGSRRARHRPCRWRHHSLHQRPVVHGHRHPRPCRARASIDRSA
jgi:hypothetical protein